MQRNLTVEDTLPRDAARALLVGRAWLPGERGGPTPVTVRNGKLVDLSALAPTIAALLERPDAAQAVRGHEGPSLGPLAEWLDATTTHGPDPAQRHLLAPNDLQVVKAAGVTFATSMVERVIEEQARGDPAKAESTRAAITAVVGDNLSRVVPGSPEAAELKQLLVARGAWSQYLEVGIGPDAEIFTKCPPMAAVGTGAEIGILADSNWNNPEPEIVLAVTSRGTIAGATLGNDVNLRDYEGRSALLLGKAKDNNASCAIGPFLRLFDASFSLEDVRRADIAMRVDGPDGFVMHGSSPMSRISRDPADLARHAIGPHHQYPDGLMLFLGTMFAPTQDRFGPGQGFTHAVGDLVTISTPKLGALVNRVNHADRITPWTFGLAALMRSIAARGR